MPKTDVENPVEKIQNLKREMENPTPETKRRKKEILQKVRKGVSKRKIADWLMDTYELSERQAYKLIRDTLKDLQEAASEISVSDIKAEYIERIEDMLETALKEKDSKTALKCQDMLNKINQLYVDKKEVEITNDVIKFSFDS